MGEIAMSTKGKWELDLDSLDNITGGTEQNNSSNEGTQQNNESGDNISDVIQENTVNNNPGTVNIGSPVVIKDTGDTTTVNIG